MMHCHVTVTCLVVDAVSYLVLQSSRVAERERERERQRGKERNDYFVFIALLLSCGC